MGCKEGFLGDGKLCVDIDECASKSTQCQEHSTCKNYPGTYKCECHEGYEGEKTCTEIDECQIGTPCKNGATCTDQLAFAQCTCAPGWNGTSCEDDIDECSTGTHDCDKGATCENTVGSFTCTCNDGYRGNGKVCGDINECGDVPEDSTRCKAKNTICTNLPGSYACPCKPGYRDDGKGCENFNQCENKNLCHEHASCIDYIGRYECLCDKGYAGDGKSCTEIDECKVGTPCKNGAACQNDPSRPGEVVCTCTKGWTGKHCEVNINECAEKTFTCVENSICKDTPGSYDCECNAGYEKKDGKCTEIDECATKPCKHGSDCVDEFRGFKCTCVRGWRGETCEEVDDNLQSASKKTDSSGTAMSVGVVAGVAAAIVVIIIVVVAAFIILRRKQATPTVTPRAIVPDKVKSDAPKPMQPVFMEPAKPESDIQEVSVGVVTGEEVGDIVSLQEYIDAAGNDTLKLGQRVVAHGYQSGVIKYIGELKSMPAMNGVTYIGIKLDKPEGSGNGTVNGVRYFDCEPFCSVFVTPHTVKAI